MTPGPAVCHPSRMGTERTNDARDTSAEPPPEDEQRRPDPIIELYKKHVDRTLLLENLKLTPEQRLLKLMDLQRFADELRRAGREARRRR